MLNRDKDFGECGSNSYGWKYYQDGKYFNGRGEELDTNGNSVEKVAESAIRVAPVPAEPKAIPKPRGRRKAVANTKLGANK